jgi:hypothetical protein
MTKAETTAEGFVAVLKALPKSERDAVIVRIAQDKDFGRDLVDLAIVDERKDEPSRPFKKRAGLSVVVPIAEWERILEELEELEEIRSYDAAVALANESVPFDQAVREIH